MTDDDLENEESEETQILLKMNLNQYAKYRGVTRPTILNAIKTGKMTAEISPEGHWVIDREQADAELARNINPKMSAAGKQRGKNKIKNPKQKIHVAKLPSHLQDKTEVVQEIPLKVPALIDSQAKREYFKALTAELEHQEKQGILINREKVRASAYKNAKIVREAFQNLPDRISAELAAENNIHKIHAKLSKAIQEVLENLSEIAKDL